MPHRAHAPLRPFLALLLGLAACSLAWAEPFTYQGELRHQGQPADGLFDFRITPYDLPEDGSARAAAVELVAIPVQSGRFTVDPDFGPGVFLGEEVWLLIEVRPSGEADFTPLQPRQRVSRTPYAQHAERSRIGGGWLNAGPVSGTFNRVSVGTHGYRSAQLLVLGNSGLSSPHIELLENEHDYARLSLSSVGPAGSEHFGFWTLAARTDPTALGGPATDRINFYNSRSGDVMSLLGDGRLGVGVFTPSEALDVDGGLRLRALQDSGASTLRPLAVDTSGRVVADAAARTKLVAFTEFRPRVSTVTTIVFNNSVMVSTPGATDQLYASVDLPHGARITGARVWLVDASSEVEIVTVLWRVPLGSNDQNGVATAISSGSNAAVLPVEATLVAGSAVVDNSAYLYYLQAYAAEVTYTGDGGRIIAIRDWRGSATRIRAVAIDYMP